MSTLKGLRARRDAKLAARHLDLTVPGLDGVVARFRPVTVSETQREAKKVEKWKDEQAANLHLNATLLAAAFEELRDEYGNILATGLSDDLVAEFAPGIEGASGADVMKGLFTEDFPLFTAGGRLGEWSRGAEVDADGDLEN